MVRPQTFLGLGGDTHVGMGNLGVSADDGNGIGGIGSQLLRMAVYGDVG